MVVIPLRQTESNASVGAKVPTVRDPLSGKTSISDARTVMLNGVSKWTGLEMPMPGILQAVVAGTYPDRK
jgi:hypothetical protein